MDFSWTSLTAGLAAGLFCGGLLAIYFFKSLKQLTLVQQTDQQEHLTLTDSLRRQIEELQDHIISIDEARETERASTQQQLSRLHEAHDNVSNSVQAILQSGKDSALTSCSSVGKGVQDLLGAVKTFERWHTDMNTLIKHNRHMHNMNEDFALIVKQMVVVTLNASIEAARAGAYGRGFSEVAKEIRTLATRAENLSSEYRRNLYENDLITTITFQDLQAGGKMIIGSVVGLGLENEKIKNALSV